MSISGLSADPITAGCENNTGLGSRRIDCRRTGLHCAMDCAPKRCGDCSKRDARSWVAGELTEKDGPSCHDTAYRKIGSRGVYDDSVTYAASSTKAAS